MSDLQQKARDCTFIQPCVVEGEPDAHTVWLKVGVQSFCLGPLACETKEHAEWTQSMLVKALLKLMRDVREADAKVCENIGKDIVRPEECAAAIREGAK